MDVPTYGAAENSVAAATLQLPHDHHKIPWKESKWLSVKVARSYKMLKQRSLVRKDLQFPFKRVIRRIYSHTDEGSDTI